jgi:hypothetical protein
MNARPWVIRVFALLALIALRPETAHACAVCFGKSDSNLAKGMNMGIFTLLFFITSVLAGLSCFFVFLAVRSSRHPNTDASLETPNILDKPSES